MSTSLTYTSDTVIVSNSSGILGHVLADGSFDKELRAWCDSFPTEAAAATVAGDITTDINALRTALIAPEPVEQIRLPTTHIATTMMELACFAPSNERTAREYYDTAKSLMTSSVQSRGLPTSVVIAVTSSFFAILATFATLMLMLVS